jgi:hypothetical protein
MMSKREESIVILFQYKSTNEAGRPQISPKIVPAMHKDSESHFYNTSTIIIKGKFSLPMNILCMSITVTYTTYHVHASLFTSISFLVAFATFFGLAAWRLAERLELLAGM